MASSRGHVNLVQRLLQLGAKPNVVPGATTVSPLYAAATFGLVDVVRTLIAAGADVNVVRVARGCLPRSRSAACSRPHLTVWVCEPHACVLGFFPWTLHTRAHATQGRADVGSPSPLNAAADAGHWGCCALLLAAQANPTLGDASKATGAVPPMLPIALRGDRGPLAALLTPAALSGVPLPLQQEMAFWMARHGAPNAAMCMLDRVLLSLGPGHDYLTLSSGAGPYRGAGKGAWWGPGGSGSRCRDARLYPL
jgi:hypothetical protein